MADQRIGPSPFFERGIDTIVVDKGQAHAQLPDLQLLLPLEDASQPQLERLLAADTFDRLLDAAARPAIADRTLLLPSRFNECLRGALAALKQEAAQRKDRNAPEAKALRRAVRLLTEEDELRELAHMYTSALYQG